VPAKSSATISSASAAIPTQIELREFEADSGMKPREFGDHQRQVNCGEIQ
jgi:hypothetical protein